MFFTFIFFNHWDGLFQRCCVGFFFGNHVSPLVQGSIIFNLITKDFNMTKCYNICLWLAIFIDMSFVDDVFLSDVWIVIFWDIFSQRCYCSKFLTCDFGYVQTYRGITGVVQQPQWHQHSRPSPAGSHSGTTDDLGLKTVRPLPLLSENAHHRRRGGSRCYSPKIWDFHIYSI